MGVMRFLVPSPEDLTAQAVQTAYFAGREEIPSACRVTGTEDGVAVERSESDSGSFHIVWHTQGHGDLALSTATLIEQEAPYNLPVELARGTINRVRQQLAIWQSVGLVVSEKVTNSLAAAVHSFAQAASSLHEPLTARQHASDALEAACDAGFELSTAYSDQALVARRRQSPKFVPLLGASVTSALSDQKVAAAFLGAFNTANVHFCWRDVESREGKYNWTTSDAQIAWAQANNLRICGGPLVQLDQQSFPDWLYLWEGDFDNLISVTGEYVRAVVTRYKGKVHLWQCAARMNSGETMSLTEEQRLRLTVRIVEVTRTTDPRTPIFVTFDQPWAEYIGKRKMDLSPLTFADALVRSELGLSGLGLEITAGTYAGATLPRDPIEFSRQIDRWTPMGLPLLITLRLPEPTSDAAAADEQSKWVSTFVPLLLAKQAVQGIFWGLLKDQQPTDHAGGLFAADGQAKPALNGLTAIKQTYK